MSFLVLSFHADSIENVLSFFCKFDLCRMGNEKGELIFCDFLIRISDFTYELEYTKTFIASNPSVPIEETLGLKDSLSLNMEAELLISPQSFFFDDQEAIARIICSSLATYFMTEATIQLGENKPHIIFSDNKFTAVV